MKKNFLFSVLCLLLITFSFNVNAQYNSRIDISVPGVGSNAGCSSYDVDIEITNIKWNVESWSELDIPTTPPGDIGTLNNGELGRVEDMQDFHAVYIEFVAPTSFHVDNLGVEPYKCDISVNLLGVDNKPVVIIYAGNTNMPVHAITDDQDMLEGFHVYPYDPYITGVATTVGLMGRVADTSSGSPCVRINATNRVGANCDLPSETYTRCNNSGLRIAQTAEQDIATYPNPAQNSLFIETNDLDVTEVNMLSLYGKTVSHKVSVRHGIDRMQINTTQLESGIYFVELNTTDGIIVKKVMIQRN